MIDIKSIMEEMKTLYLSDKRPWIVGLSGGKDSTCVTQIIYYMLLSLKPTERIKEIHIISSDTLVESPHIEKRIKAIHKKIRKAAKKDELPIKVKLLAPELNNSFWVNLIGRGYPSPNRWFRWCTDRLKINPTTDYILEKVKRSGEVVIVLGARKSESASRAQTMGKYEIKDFKLRKHTTIPGAYIYTPIENLDFQEVWAYLLQVRSPWGDNNRKLVTLYRKADGECPLVVDKNTPSCGGSRFGCWVCTVVDRDRSVEGLIEDGEIWLQPLLDFRNWLKEIRDNPVMRESMRKKARKLKWMSDYFGSEEKADIHRGHKILGPFTFETRLEILRRLLKLQKDFSTRNMQLISSEEIRAIETIWAYEGGPTGALVELISSLTSDTPGDLSHSFVDSELRRELAKICFENEISLDLFENLLIAESDLSTLSRSNGRLSKLDKVISSYVEMEAISGGNSK